MVVFIEGPALKPGDVVEAGPKEGAFWEFKNRRIEGVTFRRLKDAGDWMGFRSCQFVDCVFDRCLVNWDWGGHGSDVASGSRFDGCHFLKCDLRWFPRLHGRIERCTFQDCKWKTAMFRSNDLVANRFLGVVDSLTIWGREVPVIPGTPVREGPNLILGNDFRDADLRGLGLRAEVPVRDQLWPEGPHCAVVDRVPERVVQLQRRLDGRTDPESAALLRQADWYQRWADPETTQTVGWLRWNDPIMPEDNNRFHRALAELDLDD